MSYGWQHNMSVGPKSGCNPSQGISPSSHRVQNEFPIVPQRSMAMPRDAAALFCNAQQERSVGPHIRPSGFQDLAMQNRSLCHQALVGPRLWCDDLGSKPIFLARKQPVNSR